MRKSFILFLILASNLLLFAVPCMEVTTTSSTTIAISSIEKIVLSGSEISFDGASETFSLDGIKKIRFVDAVDAVQALPKKINFSTSVSPNPFNPTTSIFYTLNKNSDVNISIYNNSGQKIRNLFYDKKEVGRHSITWDGKENSGKKVASGLYVISIKINQTLINHKVVLLK